MIPSSLRHSIIAVPLVKWQTTETEWWIILCKNPYTKLTVIWLSSILISVFRFLLWVCCIPSEKFPIVPLHHPDDKHGPDPLVPCVHPMIFPPFVPTPPNKTNGCVPLRIGCAN